MIYVVHYILYGDYPEDAIDSVWDDKEKDMGRYRELMAEDEDKYPTIWWQVDEIGLNVPDANVDVHLEMRR